MQKWTNWFSPVSNGNPAEEEEEGSQEGSVESVEYVSDSGETEEESEEEEGKMRNRTRHPHHQSLELNVVTNPWLRRLLQRPRVPRQLLLWFRVPCQLLPWFRVLGAQRGPGTLLPSPRTNLPRWPNRVDPSLGKLCLG